MKLSELKTLLNQLESIAFKLPNGELVPAHFHVTEVGKIAKKFIDCGGTLREENKVNFQLWDANDYNHRLHPDKLSHIIDLSQKTLGIDNELEIEVEYQGQTIEKFSLDFDGKNFLLTTTQTDCLAKDKCGVPQEKPKVRISNIPASNSCAPNSGCC